MLYLVTGTPGSGKSLMVIDWLKEETERPIFYDGIEGLNLPWTQLSDVESWPELVPDNAIVVIDEVQRYFGTRDPKKPVPSAVAALETHRHRGLDVYFITQHPSMLDHHARRLVGDYRHLNRPFGAKHSRVQRDNHVFDAAKPPESVVNERFYFPKKTFRLYKSAEVHTHKLRLPKKLLLIPVLLSAVLGFSYLGFSALADMEAAASGRTMQASELVSSEQLNLERIRPGANDAQPVLAGVRFNDPSQRRARIQTLPWTAPIYDQSLPRPAARDVPRLSACVVFEGECRCFTQQATGFDTSEEVCRNFVENGSYMPFKTAIYGDESGEQDARESNSAD